MRAVFGLLGLLIVVAVIGLLTKRQLAAPAGLVGAPASTPQQQSQQLQNQVKKSVEDAMRQTRPEPEDK
jgi:Tfp pilus assembly protein FimT